MSSSTLSDMSSTYAPYTAALLGAPLVVYLLVPLLLRGIGSLLGTYLRKKTAGRRAYLLDLKVSDEKAYASTAGQKKNNREQSDKDSSDSWEAIDAQSTSKVDGRGKPTSSREWSGIIGFLHPFW